jgi:hypothetical protein
MVVHISKLSGEFEAQTARQLLEVCQLVVYECTHHVVASIEVATYCSNQICRHISIT